MGADVDYVCHGCKVADATLTPLEGAVSFKMSMDGCGLNDNTGALWKRPRIMNSDVASEVARLDPAVKFLTVGDEADLQGYCVFDNTASCTDHFHNGDEDGIDC